MASLTDSPGLVAARQSARAQQSLINRQYRYAKRRGDFGEALKAMRAGEELGLPIGRPVHSEELDGAGEAMYNFDMGGRGQPSGRLDGFDFRHSRDGGQGVGGYDFGQRRNRDSPMLSQFAQGMGDDFDSRMGMDADPGVTGRNIDPGFTNNFPSAGVMPQRTAPIAASGSFYGKPDQRSAFSRAWQSAPDQATRDSLVQRAKVLGVPMNNPAPQAPAAKSASYLDSPEFLAARERDQKMRSAFSSAIQPPDKDMLAMRNSQLEAEGMNRRSDSEAWDRYLQSQPGWNDPEAYAAEKIAGVDANQRQLEGLIGRHQSDLQREVEAGDALTDFYKRKSLATLAPNNSESRRILGQSRRSFGTKAYIPLPSQAAQMPARFARQTPRY